MAEEMGDPCWEALALRGLALVRVADGRVDEGLAILDRALGRCRRHPDTYKWAEIVILTELVGLEHGSDPGRRREARRLAHDAGLPVLVGRVDRVSERQTLPQTPAP